MSADWTSGSIGDVFELVNGFAFKSKDFLDSGVPVIKIKNVKAGQFSEHDFSYVDRHFLSSRVDKIARYDDLLISMSGNRHDGSPETWVGKVALFRKKAPYLINQRVGALRLKDEDRFDPRYMSYLLSSWDYQSLFIAIATSSGGQANLSPKQILGATITYPEIKIQRKIAKILGALDDKIELNRQINQTLEQMAQAIFKSWFVDFDPVHAKVQAIKDGRDPIEAAAKVIGNPALEQTGESLREIAALFPSEFEESELGLVPKGWGVSELKDICRVINGRAYKNTEFKDSGTPIVRIQNLSSGGKTVYSDLDLPIDKLIEKEDLIYAWSATFGPHIWRGPKSIYHYHIWKLDPDTERVDKYFLYQYLSRITERMKNAGTGSIFTHLTKKNMESQKILLPTAQMMVVAENIYSGIYKKITVSTEEIITLSLLRDALLPKLLSGEIRVGDVERQAEEII